MSFINNLFGASLLIIPFVFGLICICVAIYVLFEIVRSFKQLLKGELPIWLAIPISILEFILSIIIILIGLACMSVIT